MTPALLLLLGALAHADAQSSFEAGITASRAGDHAAAEARFREALAEGGRDPAVYHGLGEALYRQGELGLAIAAWERGLRLAPQNGDLAANLTHARKQTTDRLDPPAPELGPLFWQASLSLGQSAALASAGLTLALTGLLLIRGARPTSRAGALARRLIPLWSGLGAAGLLLALSTLVAARQAPAAVVVVPQVSARSALGPEGVDLFVLHEGATVRLAETTESAAQVLLPDGRKGWITLSALASTDPAAPLPDPVL